MAEVKERSDHRRVTILSADDGLRLQEEVEQAHEDLDTLGAPRQEGGLTLSLSGRVIALQREISALRTRNTSLEIKLGAAASVLGE